MSPVVTRGHSRSFLASLRERRMRRRAYREMWGWPELLGLINTQIRHSLAAGVAEGRGGRR